MLKLVNDLKEANCVTHSGTMHADEVFATAFLELFLSEVRLLRVNQFDITNLNKEIIVYDIGRAKFDHHQENALIRPTNIPYSSLGLLWKEYGEEFLAKENVSNYQEVFSYIDKDFIEGIDAVDNGVFPTISANYKVKTLSDIIKLFNPSYQSFENENTQFLKAVAVAKEIFKEEVINAEAKIKAKHKVQTILQNTTTKYLLLDEFLPYEEEVLTNELAKDILFVIFPSNRGGYAIKTLPKSLDDKTPRQEFPHEWGGLVNEDLEQVVGIKGLIFCHKNRFILTCKDKITALKIMDLLLSKDNDCIII